MYTQSAVLTSKVSFRKAVTATSGAVAIGGTFNTVSVTNDTTYCVFVLSGTAITVTAIAFAAGGGSTMVPPGRDGQFRIPLGHTHLAFVFESGGTGNIEYQLAILA